MKKNILQVTILTLLLFPVAVIAQDARYSQFFNNPLLLNPAMAGNGIEHIRVTAIYRNQWAGMGTPFTTQGFAVDKVVNRIGIGAVITRNGAGDASIRTLNFVGNLAYHLPLGAEKINTLSGGIQVGIVNKSFDPSKLTFDNQYNPDAGYDPNIGSGEDFSSTSVTRPDVNVGFAWQRGCLQKDIRFKPFLGWGYAHVTRPDETFIMDVTKVHAKQTIYGGAGYLLKPGLEIRPSFMLLNQGPSKETTFGSMLNYQFDNKNSVQLGAYNRMHDAVIAYAGYQMNLLFVGMSYDVNTSELSKSGKGNNAFEISLTYSPRPRKKKAPVKTTEQNVPRVDNLTFIERAAIQPSKITIPDVLIHTPIVIDSPSNIPEDLVIAETAPEKIKVAGKIETGVPVIKAETPVKITNSDSENLIMVEPVPDKMTTVEIKKSMVKAIPVETPIKIASNTSQNLVMVEPDQEKISTAEIIETSVPVIPVEPPVNIADVVLEPAKPVVTKTAPEEIKDTDMDGVSDKEDECPYIKGPLLSKGCPDSDGDGLIDMKDNCPMESGTLENNGCPDAEIISSIKNQQLIKKFDNILFATGMVKLTTDDIFDIIERAIDIMYADRSTKVILSGHTDSEGDEYQNMILSQARAEVVKRYMINQGIDAGRIETVAYGETMPLETNMFEEGMKLNRRVEINILKK